MKVISQIELDKEQLYLEKQKQIISDQREKLMIERSRLYYEWRDHIDGSDSRWCLLCCW